MKPGDCACAVAPETGPHPTCPPWSPAAAGRRRESAALFGELAPLPFPGRQDDCCGRPRWVENGGNPSRNRPARGRAVFSL